MKPRLLDLYCGAGGAASGLDLAGFEVVGVDIEPQPNYPFEFHEADALDYPLHGFDAYWASPPCQGYAHLTKHKCLDSPLLIDATRERLSQTGKPYIIENVAGAPLREPFMLCGTMFGLKVIRHRYFEVNFALLVPKHQKHNGSPRTGQYITVAGHGGQSRDYKVQSWRDAMGIDWMTKYELTQAVPPIYAEFLGRQMMLHIRVEVKDELASHNRG